MHVKKKLISLVLALGMLGGTQTALAAEPAAQEAAPLPAWSYGMLADGYSLGLFGDEIYTQHSQTVTTEQLDTMTKVVADKLALLEMETRPASEEGLVIDTTRGGVVNALYQEAAAYAFPGIEAGAEEFMTSVGALAGDGSSLRLEEPCTLLEGRQSDSEPVRPAERRFPGPAVEGGQRGGQHPVPAGEHPHRREQHLPLPQAAAGHHPERGPGVL